MYDSDLEIYQNRSNRDELLIVRSELYTNLLKVRHMYICVYIYVSMCVFGFGKIPKSKQVELIMPFFYSKHIQTQNTNTINFLYLITDFIHIHIHTHMHVYIHTYITYITYITYTDTTKKKYNVTNVFTNQPFSRAKHTQTQTTNN